MPANDPKRTYDAFGAGEKSAIRFELDQDSADELGARIRSPYIGRAFSDNEIKLGGGS